MLYIEQYSRPNVFVANSVFTVQSQCKCGDVSRI